MTIWLEVDTSKVNYFLHFTLLYTSEDYTASVGQFNRPPRTAAAILPESTRYFTNEGINRIMSDFNGKKRAIMQLSATDFHSSHHSA